MKKYSFYLAVSVILLHTYEVFPQNINPIDEKKCYVGINLIAPLSGAKKSNSYLTAIVPIFSNLEYDLAISFGYFVKKNQTLEIRASYSRMDFATIPQLQTGYYYYFSGNKLSYNKDGLYVGANFRMWDYYNRNTEIHNFNISPAFAAGYRFNIDDFYVDARINQMVGVFGWSSMEHSKPACKFTLSPISGIVKVLPMIGLDFGYKF